MTTESYELFVYTVHTREVYDVTAPTLDALALHIVRKTYCAEKAMRAWERVAAVAAKEYAREHGSGGDVWHRMFPPRVRREAAQQLAEYYAQQLVDLATAWIGPESLIVEVYDWSHDMYGNPIAHHSVVGDGVSFRTRRRQQVGYSSERDSYAATAIYRAGAAPRWYELAESRIDRHGLSVLTYHRKPVTT